MPMSEPQRDTVTSLLGEIADVGTDHQRGGYSRPIFSGAELELREWFVAHASKRGLQVDTDRNGIIWAWAGGPGDGAIVTGSHLDSVPGGGAFDGPLGVPHSSPSTSSRHAASQDVRAPSQCSPKRRDRGSASPALVRN